jgi:predicted transcriptional regulator
MDNPFRNLLIILIAIIFFIVPAAASVFHGNEIIVEPGYDYLQENPPDDVVKISFWELSPRSIVMFSLVAISPLLLYPAELFFLFRVCALFGIRRLTKRDLLDHKGRRAIYDFIRKNPGVPLVDITETSGLNRGTVRYHLDRLGIAGKIMHTSVSGRARYYANCDDYTGLEKKIIAHLQNDSRSKILFHLLESRASSRREMSDALGVAGPTVTWHMYRLIHDQIAARQKEGKFTSYALNPDVVPVVRKYFPS